MSTNRILSAIPVQEKTGLKVYSSADQQLLKLAELQNQKILLDEEKLQRLKVLEGYYHPRKLCPEKYEEIQNSLKP